MVDILDQARRQFKSIASRQGLLGDSVCVTTAPLSPRQAIGTPVRHCKDNEPEKCAVEISSDLMKRFGRLRIGMIGYQPAILERLTEKFGAANIVCTDLNPANIGEVRYGVEIWDGTSQTLRLIDWGDLVLATSSTLSNGTLDAIYEEAVLKKKKLVIFGITGAGVAALLGLDRLCFYGH